MARRKHVALCSTSALIIALTATSGGATCVLSPQLQLQVNDPGFVNVKISVLIRMKVSDTDAAKAHIDQIVEQATSALERRKLVYNALRYESDTVQNRAPCGGTSVRSALATAVAAGTADDVAPHWLDDFITAKAIPAVIKAICNRADVRDIMLNGTIGDAPAASSDTGSSWNIDRLGYPQYFLWPAGITGAGAVVGVIDTGANLDHEDLASLCSGGTEDGETCVGDGRAQACTAGGGRCLGPEINLATGQPYWMDVTNNNVACTGGTRDGQSCSGRVLAQACSAGGGHCTKESPYDDHGHGSFMVGVATGQHGIGVAPEANWIACKARTVDPGTGGPIFDRNFGELVDCAEYLSNPDNVVVMQSQHAPHAADVILFPGVLNPEPTDDSGSCRDLEGFQSAVANLRAMEILPVFPIGEGPVTGAVGVPSPANYRGALAVGLSADTESSASPLIDPTSNHGTLLCLDDHTAGSRPAPAILAPGKGVRGPWKALPPLTSTYKMLSGSDVAAAHVAGAAAILRALNPDISIRPLASYRDDQHFVLDDILIKTAANYRETPFRPGRLNVFGATLQNSEYVSQDVPFPSPFYTSDSGLVPNLQAVKVTMRNMGPYTWVPSAPTAVGERGPIQLQYTTSPDPWNASPVALPPEAPRVKPGQEVAFAFDVRAPFTLDAAGVHPPGPHYQTAKFGFQWWMSDPFAGIGSQTTFGPASPALDVVVSGRDRATPGTPSPALAELPSYPCATVTIPMRNTGTTTWTRAGTPGYPAYTGRYRYFLPNGTMLLQGTIDLGGTVPPEAVENFSVYLCAPVPSGTYPFAFEVLRDGTPLQFGATLQAQIPVVNSATVVPNSFNMLQGQAGTSVIVQMTNTGTRAWDSNYCINEIHTDGRFSYVGNFFPECRTPSSVIKPGNSVWWGNFVLLYPPFSLTVVTPGSWNYNLRLYANLGFGQVEWFGDAPGQSVGRPAYFHDRSAGTAVVLPLP